MFSSNRADGAFHVVFINVNKATIGDSTLITYPDGYTVLVDAGVEGEGINTIIPFLKARGINTINRFVISHMHADHFGGLMEMLKSPEIKFEEIWWSPIPHDLYLKYEKQYIQEREGFVPHFDEFMKTSSIRLVQPKVGQYEVKGDVSLRVLDTAMPRIPVVNYINNNNIVLQFRYKSFTALLAGDQGFEEETRVMRRFSSVRSTLYKLSHHAGAGSNGQRWMRQVTPEIAVAPMPAWLSPDPRGVDGYKRYSPYIGKFYRTWQHGNIEVVSDGSSYKVITEKSA